VDRAVANDLNQFYVHWWDFSTSIPELMKSLNRLLDSGKVLYLGISDTPAWVVSKANEYARCTGLTPFSVYQGRWSAANRDGEREILPMCETEGMAILAFGALGSGRFKPKALKDTYGKGDGRKAWTPSAKDEKISAVLEEIAERKGAKLLQVVRLTQSCWLTMLNIQALAYVVPQISLLYPFDRRT